jgi:hypothetical protein
MGFQALLQRPGKLAHDDRMTARASCHHDHATPGKFVASLASLHPREELGFAHAQIGLDVHDDLT